MPTAAPGRRFRVQFGAAHPLTAVATLPAADGTLAIGGVAGLETIAVHAGTPARWHVTRATSAASLDHVDVTWTPSSAWSEAALPEVSFLARADVLAARPGAPLSDQIAAGTVHAAIDAAATPTAVTISTPAALDPASPQSVRFQVDAPLDSLARAFLVYELTGLQQWTAAVHSINDSPVEGGFAPVTGAAGGVQVEEIPVRALVHGENSIRWFAADRTDAIGYTVRSLRLVAFTHEQVLASEASLANDGAGGGDPRPLVDGRLTTGTTGDTAVATPAHTIARTPSESHGRHGHGAPPNTPAATPAEPAVHESDARLASTGYSLTYGSPVQPVAVSFHLGHAMAGTIDLSADGTGAHQRIALDGLVAGWHSVPVDDAVGVARTVRVGIRGGHESTGFVSEVHVSSLALAAPDASSPHIALFHPLHGECVARDGVAIRGALARSG
ncbi:MAG: hypothetical protein WCJ30_11840, partial [Deltaproteobacteria bacterium]